MPARFVSLLVTETWKMVEGQRGQTQPATVTPTSPEAERAADLDPAPPYSVEPGSPADATCPAIAQ